MRALESLKVGGGVALLMGMSVSTAGCANDYTCVDYRNCAPDGSADASADVVRGDARGDGSVTHDGAAHDGATDGGSDARVVDGGAEAAPVDSGKDAGCNPSGPPSTSPCSIADEYAVFVAPSKDGGSDAGTGTMAAPYATIAEGIANAGGKRVYVCSATYAESLVIGTSLDGAQVYGGFACPASDAGAPAWTYVSGMVAAVAPGVAGYALDLESLSKGAHFEDMSFTAVAATGSSGASSIAVLVNASSGVSFTRVTATSGAGAVGSAGAALATNWCASSLNGAVAAGATATTGAPAVLCACPVSGTTQSGVGGALFNTGGTGFAMPAATPMGLADSKGGAGAVVAPPSNCMNGDDGPVGASGIGGIAGAQGALSRTGWTPGAVAGSGAAGDPGAGAGGGGGGAGTGGSSGGAGGCGGNGASGGSGGGASLSVAVVGSGVTFTDVKLAAAAGGIGGTGFNGQAGQGGGTGGGTGGQCSGGNGGNGGSGGGGGGGAGGPSVGIGWVGATTSITIDGTVTTTATTLTSPSSFSSPGTPSSGGAGGTGGTTVNMGPPGFTGAVANLSGT